MDEQNIGSILQGGGVVAFAGAVWFQVREIHKVLERALDILSRLEERTRDLPDPPSRRAPTGPV
jgi:hypothetical protein